ncbi:MAG: acetyl-CoA carboxylase, biotin carboxyl carrier protein, partial [Verrucomicrobia bacterium]|nr:acetyl-CoA carboxylase, biotin carboxyl carrier protein [Verrucomicrobiota bacterium]
FITFLVYIALRTGTDPVASYKRVNAETVVCIIEAMKVMNEIKAEMSGTITEILAESGKPVEFGKPLFRIKPA